VTPEAFVQITKRPELYAELFDDDEDTCKQAKKQLAVTRVHIFDTSAADAAIVDSVLAALGSDHVLGKAVTMSPAAVKRAKPDEIFGTLGHSQQSKLEEFFKSAAKRGDHVIVEKLTRTEDAPAPPVSAPLGDRAALLGLLKRKSAPSKYLADGGENMQLCKVVLAGETFKLVSLGNANLSGADLSEVTFNQCSLSDVNFASSKLVRLKSSASSFKGARFQGADLSDSTFKETSVEGADFASAVARRVKWSGVSGMKASFQGADLRDAKITGSSFLFCNFKDANLAGAKLAECSLNDSDFTGCDLSGADLRGASFCTSKLSNAKLDGAKLDGATYDKKTRWPNEPPPGTVKVK
jgi:uncharacterized protein YjbI with pentapeptide repeats